jgi:hypothetical protein
MSEVDICHALSEVLSLILHEEGFFLVGLYIPHTELNLCSWKTKRSCTIFGLLAKLSLISVNREVLLGPVPNIQGERAKGAIIDEICTLVGPAAGGGVHTRDNIEGGILAAAAASAIFMVIKIGVVEGELHRFVDIADICIETNALELGFHLVGGQGEAIVGGKKRRLSSGPIINLQSMEREKKTSFLVECLEVLSAAVRGPS